MTNKRFSAKVVFASLIACFLLLAYNAKAETILKGSYEYIDINGKVQTVTWLWDYDPVTKKKTTIFTDTFLGSDLHFENGYVIPYPAGMPNHGKMASPLKLDNSSLNNQLNDDSLDNPDIRNAVFNMLNNASNKLDFKQQSDFALKVKANPNEIEANLIFNTDNTLDKFDNFELKCSLIEMNSFATLMRDIPISVNEPTIIPVNGLLKEGISYVLAVSSPVGIEAYTIFQVSTNGDQIKK